MYLDHRDFGSKNVPKDVPRIAVWKQDMVKIYSDLDEIDDENYGPRPLKDFSDTCYYKVFFFLHVTIAVWFFFLYFLCPFVLYHQILFLFFSTVACTCAKFRIISQQVGYSYRRQFACKFEGQHI